jgi:hypothetical protein
MSVSRASLETGAHSRQKWRLALIRDEYRVPRQDVDEFILFRMGVAKCRARTRNKARKIHPEVRQTKYVAQRALLTSSHARREWLWIV